MVINKLELDIILVAMPPHLEVLASWESMNTGNMRMARVLELLLSSPGTLVPIIPLMKLDLDTQAPTPNLRTPPRALVAR